MYWALTHKWHFHSIRRFHAKQIGKRRSVTMEIKFTLMRQHNVYSGCNFVSVRFHLGKKSTFVRIVSTSFVSFCWFSFTLTKRLRMCIFGDYKCIDRWFNLFLCAFYPSRLMSFWFVPFLSNWVEVCNILHFNFTLNLSGWVCTRLGILQFGGPMVENRVCTRPNTFFNGFYFLFSICDNCCVNFVEIACHFLLWRICMIY